MITVCKTRNLYKIKVGKFAFISNNFPVSHTHGENLKLHIGGRKMRKETYLPPLNTGPLAIKFKFYYDDSLAPSFTFFTMTIQFKK